MWRYAPDLDERTPNILVSGLNVVPTMAGGFKSAYTAPAANAASGMPQYPVTGTVPVGARYLLRQDGTDRLFVGSATVIYEANQTVAYAWTDESRVGGYSGVVQWMFDVYGDTMLASASLGTHTEIQASTGAVGTNFANLTNAPLATIIVVQDNALYAFDYNSGGGRIYDGWIRSDTGNITNWTTGESVSGAFTETPGAITAAIKHGNGVVVFKNRGMWRGQYVGLPEVVRWELVTESVGCIGPLAVVNVDDVLYFADANGVWMYDGSRPRPIDDGLRNFIYPTFRRAGAEAMQIGIDDRQCLLTFHAITTSAKGDQFYPFNYRTGAWGPPNSNFVGSGDSTYDVCCVCNGPGERLYAMPGMPGLGFPANAAWFVGTGSLKSFHSSVIDADSATASRSFLVVPSQFGDDHKGRGISGIFHDFRGTFTASGTGTGAVTVQDTLTGYRRPFSKGTAQSTDTQSYSSTYGYTSIRGNANWYSDTLAFTASAAAVNDTMTVLFEWVGFSPEFSGSVLS